MAARKRKKPAASSRRGTQRRATRSLLGARSWRPLPALALEPHQVDIAALALIAIGFFLAGVGYLHWSGGTAGEGAITAFRFLLGALGYAVPAALVVAGALLLARELRPPARPIRTGVLCLVASLTLALAAGTPGIRPRALPRQALW